MGKRARIDKRVARSHETPAGFGGQAASQGDVKHPDKRSKDKRSKDAGLIPTGLRLDQDEPLIPIRGGAADTSAVPWTKEWEEKMTGELTDVRDQVGGWEGMGYMGDDGRGMPAMPPDDDAIAVPPVVDDGIGNLGRAQRQAMVTPDDDDDVDSSNVIDDGRGILEPTPAIARAQRRAERALHDAAGQGTADDGQGVIGTLGYGLLPDVRREGIEEIREIGGKGGIARPLLALDLHLDLINWLDTELALERRWKWWEGYYASRGISDKTARRPLMEELVVEQVTRERAMLDIAQTLYVGDEMLDLALAVAAKDRAEPLRSTDPWCPCGMVFLAKPLHYWAARQLNSEVISEPLDIVAIGWNVAGVGRPDPEGGWQPSLGLELWIYGAVQPLADFINATNPDDPPLDPRRTIQEFGPMPLMDSSAWAVDLKWEAATSIEEIEEVERGVAADELNPMKTVPWLAKVRKLLKAIWRLLDQEIIAVEPARLARAAVRRSKRMRPRMDGDAVNVIHLRRIVDLHTHEPLPLPDLAERLTTTHSWRVRSHWRHLQRGDGIVSEDGSKILLDDAYHWRDCPALRITNTFGHQERLRIKSYDNGWATLQWESHLRGMVEVERLALVGGYVKGIGLLIERYDVVDFSR